MAEACNVAEDMTEEREIPALWLYYQLLKEEAISLCGYSSARRKLFIHEENENGVRERNMSI